MSIRTPHRPTRSGPPELARRAPAGRMARPRSGRRPMLRAAALLTAAACVVATLTFLVLRRSHEVVRAAGPRPPSETLAWSVALNGHGLVAVVASNGHGASAVLAIPRETRVDLPGGGAPTVGEAGTTAGMLMAAVQGVLGRRVDHYLLSRPSDLARLIDRLGGVSVPGAVRLSGSQAVAYLGRSTDLDGSTRWERVLSGILSRTGPGAIRPSAGAAFGGRLGASDDPAAAGRILSGAGGALVTELPTAPAVGGGLEPDRRELDNVLGGPAWPPAAPLIRVGVLNGNGRPGMGAALAALLSPHGFRVEASQNARSFGVRETKIAASESSFLGPARRLRAILGVGKVYVGTIPSGSADIIVLVGRDLRKA